ncbi:ribulose-phosphate 3-epimerase [Streptomyces sp. NPDC048111]|uniref:ribulose-phosphate 3-epimerase n=1 Tax=Streptomyces sp. NPDC048111 TaxID=3365500 RepID=UPI003710793D
MALAAERPGATVTRHPALAISVVCVDQTRLGGHIRTLHGLGIARLHVDLVDPAFGGGLGLPLETISDLRASCDLPIDVHIMLTDPAPAVREAVARGAATVCVHQRSLTDEVTGALKDASDQGTSVSLAVDPDESISLPDVWNVRPHRLTVMSVVPGGAGRSFRPEALDTVAEAAQLRDAGVIGEVEVDGAVGPDTAPRMAAGGADLLVLGSTVFPHRSPRLSRLQELRAALDGQPRQSIA